MPVMTSLKKLFSSKSDSLGQNERLTLAAAASERVVTHALVREMTVLHPFDLTRMLQDLVHDGFLEAHIRVEEPFTVFPELLQPNSRKYSETVPNNR